MKLKSASSGLQKYNPDVVITEIGGTVDIESLRFGSNSVPQGCGASECAVYARCVPWIPSAEK